MKVCRKCGEEIATKDGENFCNKCKIPGGVSGYEPKEVTDARARKNRRAREDALRSLGLKKVNGALGGTYWE